MKPSDLSRKLVKIANELNKPSPSIESTSSELKRIISALETEGDGTTPSQIFSQIFSPHLIKKLAPLTIQEVTAQIKKYGQLNNVDPNLIQDVIQYANETYKSSLGSENAPMWGEFLFLGF